MNHDTRLLKTLIREYLIIEGYYDLSRMRPTPSIKYVIDEWVRSGNKAYDPDETYHAMYPAEEIWPYREYSWSSETAAGQDVIGKDMNPYQDKWHFVPMDDEGLVVGRSRWDFMVEELRKKGWKPTDPLYFEIGKNGVAKVGEGNHRLAIARELDMMVPVLFSFKQHVEKSRASNV
jgi:hypothetical protein